MTGNSRALQWPARRHWLARVAALGLSTTLPSSVLAAASLKVGAPAPPLVLHTLDGLSISSEGLRGKVVILTFWATWCEPCRDELPLLSQFAARHASQGLQVLGFTLDGPENLDAVREVAAKLSFPVGLLGNPWAGGYGRIWHLPVNFTIDRAGMLADNGWLDDHPAWTESRLNRVVVPLLEATSQRS